MFHKDLRVLYQLNLTRSEDNGSNILYYSKCTYQFAEAEKYAYTNKTKR